MKNWDKSVVGYFLWLFDIVISAILLFVGGAIDNSAMNTIGFIGGITGIVIAIWYIIKAFEQVKEDDERRAEEKMQLIEELKQCATFSREYDYSEHTSYETLSIKKLSPLFSHSLTIKKVMLTPMSYNPQKYIYTSATVGGITTGGIDKVGGNYVSGKEVDSGKCELKYFGQKIQRIKLTDELYKKAEKSVIKNYLNDKKQIVIEGKSSDSVIVSAQILGIHSLTTQAMLYEGYPTREKCQEIIDWICEAE